MMRGAPAVELLWSRPDVWFHVLVCATVICGLFNLFRFLIGIFCFLNGPFCLLSYAYLCNNLWPAVANTHTIQIKTHCISLSVRSCLMKNLVCNDTGITIFVYLQLLGLYCFENNVTHS